MGHGATNPESPRVGKIKESLYFGFPPSFLPVFVCGSPLLLLAFVRGSSLFLSATARDFESAPFPAPKGDHETGRADHANNKSKTIPIGAKWIASAAIARVFPRFHDGPRRLSDF